MFADVLVNLVKVAAVFGLLFVTLKLLNTWQRQRGGVRSSGRRQRDALVEKLDETRVGRNASVVTLKVGETVLLVGVTEQHVEHLADVTDSVDLTRLEIEDDGEGPTPFEHALALLRQRTGQQP